MVMTIPAALRYAKEKLTPFSDEAATEARLIVAHLCGWEPNRLALCDKTINHSLIDEIAEQRKNGRPLQYIFGKWWFYKSEFLVGEGVLIPRQDTELLVEAGLRLISNIENPTLADLCAGSGCVGISLALEREDAAVLAVEKYDEAFDWLCKNTKHTGAKNVTPLKADALDPLTDKYDLILCNPPYIPLLDKETLAAEVLNEPHSALFGGDDGLDFYRAISHSQKNSLKKGGFIAFEVGIDEADLVAEILKQEGFTEISTEKDILGIQRVVFGTPKPL